MPDPINEDYVSHALSNRNVTFRLMWLIGWAVLAAVFFVNRDRLSSIAPMLVWILMGATLIAAVAMSSRVFQEPDTFSAPPPPWAEARASGEMDIVINGMPYYEKLTRESRVLAAGLYNRSGVYLLVGVFLAVTGIATFYVLRPVVETAVAPIEIVIALLPGSSMLLLSELIAFFFLRQSRAVMDEFRYFDRLARNREEVLAALRIARDSNIRLTIKDLISAGFYFTKGDHLLAGESTELIETRKLEKTEIDLLNKVVELISRKKP